MDEEWYWMIMMAKCGLNFLTFVLQLRENTGKNLNQETDPTGFEPGPSGWEVTTLSLGYNSSGIYKWHSFNKIFCSIRTSNVDYCVLSPSTTYKIRCRVSGTFNDMWRRKHVLPSSVFNILIDYRWWPECIRNHLSSFKCYYTCCIPGIHNYFTYFLSFLFSLSSLPPFFFTCCISQLLLNVSNWRSWGWFSVVNKYYCEMGKYKIDNNIFLKIISSVLRIHHLWHVLNFVWSNVGNCVYNVNYGYSLLHYQDLC